MSLKFPESFESSNELRAVIRVRAKHIFIKPPSNSMDF